MNNNAAKPSFRKNTFNRFLTKEGGKKISKQPFNHKSRPRRDEISATYNDNQSSRIFSKDGIRDVKSGDRRRDYNTKRKDGIDLNIDYINLDDGQRRIGFSPFQIRLVQSILTSTLSEGNTLDKSYSVFFAKVKLESVEQGFIIKQINAMFSHLSYYAYVAGLKRPSDFSRHINRLIVVYCMVKNFSVPNLDCEGFDRSGIAKRIREANDDVLLSQGCPIWLEEQASRELKALWAEERQSLGLEPKRFIRANTLKTTRENLAKELSSEGVVTRPVKDSPIALEVTSNSALFRTKCFKNGFFEQQDAGSQLIAPFLELEPGLRVIDTCAGAGGKTLHIAALMQGRGSIIALDTQEWKLAELKKRARRAGAFNIEPRHISSGKIIKRLYEHADRVLIDAPCSGTGVMRRTVDSKWRDARSSLNELREIQKDILERYSKIARVGGLVVYATCSILPSENRMQIDSFLEKHKDSFELVEDRQIMPSSGFDGFYMAKLKRIAK